MYNSWDLFDTLIFRFCEYPDKIFQYIGDDEFATVRKRLHGTFNAIYSKLQVHFCWSDEETKRRMQLELDEEWKQIFPVYNTVSQVQPNDIIVSDMYLPYEFIEKIVRVKCKLNNVIFLSLDGKSTGNIWKIIKKSYSVYPSTHTGDNTHSDIEVPNRFGIKTKFVSTNIKGANLLARACLLQNPFDGFCSDLYELTSSFTTIFHLQCAHKLNTRFPHEEFVFLTRDCCFMYYVMKKLFPHRKCNILQSSRLIFDSVDCEYDIYYDSIVNANSVIVDGNGSGISYKNYTNRRKIPIQPYVFLNKLLNIPGKPDMIEILTSVPFGSFVGYNKLTTLEYPRVLGYVIETCFQTFLSLPYFPIDNTPKTIVSIMNQVFQRCHNKNHKFTNVDPNEYTTFSKFMKVENPVSLVKLAPVYVLSQIDERKKHMNSMLRNLSFTEIEFITPEPQENDYTNSLSEAQTSHVISYIKMLQNIHKRCYIFEDDILSINGHYDTVMLLDYAMQFTDSVTYLEFCLGDENLCSDETLLPKPACGSTFFCTAAIAYSSIHAIKKFRSQIQNKLIFDKKILPTDGVISSLIHNCDISNEYIRVSYPVFYQAVQFGSTIKGSMRGQKPICNKNIHWSDLILSNKNIHWSDLILSTIKYEDDNASSNSSNNKLFIYLLIVIIAVFFFLFVSTYK